jgi:general secretion pathway protein J
VKPNRQAGFTLLEILVALVVFGFLLIGLNQGLHFGLRAWNGQAAMIAKRGDLDAVDRTLRGLIGQMAPGFKIDPPNIVGRPHGFAFTTKLPEAAGIAGLADVSLTVDRRHDFILRWTPHRHAVSLVGAPVTHDTVLLHEVARVDFAYWRNTPAGGGWLRAWNGWRPPALVRIKFVFVNHGRRAGRRWPAIVAAPMRAPAG